VATEPAVSYLPKDIFCPWCLVIMEDVVAIVQDGDNATVLILAKVKAAVVEAVTAETLALAGEGYLCFVATLLAFLFLAQTVTA
jgi:hypothetical protein